MKKYIFIFILVFFTGCTIREKQKQLNEKEREKLIIDTRILKSLNDSFNKTGDYKYMKKYIVKINRMITEFPDQKGLVQVRDNYIEMFGDSIK